MFFQLLSVNKIMKIILILAVFSNFISSALAFSIDATQMPYIVIPANPSAAEKFAAEELQTYLEKITGSKAKIVSGAVTGKAIVLGAHPANDALDWKSLSPDEFVIDSTPDALRIAGGREAAIMNNKDGKLYVQERGTLYGVYELLESLGVRWYRPEAWGENVPLSKTLDIPDGRKKYQPGYKYRVGMASYCHWTDETPAERAMAQRWAIRNRINVIESFPQYGGSINMGRGHAYKYLVPPEKYFDKHPEYFALIDGKRDKSLNVQLCLSNPDVQNLVASRIIEDKDNNPQKTGISIEPNDYSKWCECGECRKMDEPKLQGTRDLKGVLGKTSMSNRVCRFNNIVAEKVHAKYPDLKLSWYAYNAHTQVPTSIKSFAQPAPVVWIAAYAGAYSDWNRKLEDPASPQNSRLLESLKGYPKLGAEIMIYEYLTGYAWLGPMPALGVIADRLKNYRKYNVKGIYSMPVGNWGGQGITSYLTVKMMWNPDLDVDKEISLYCKNCFGPAAEPMKRYFEIMTAALPSSAQVFSGGSNLRAFFTPALLAKLNPLIDEAAKLVAGKQPYEKYFKQFAAAHHVACEISKAESLKNDGNSKAALATLIAVDAFVGNAEIGTFENREHGEPRGRGLKRMIDDAMAGGLDEEGVSRVVVNLDKEWLFTTGDNADYSSPDFESKTADWKVIDADRWWQQQGFSGYNGTGWYRKWFVSPATAADKQIVFLIGAVDGDAYVYLNGQKIGEHILAANGDGWNRSFQFDITKLVKAGEKNLIAVKCVDPAGMSGMFKGVKILETDMAADIPPQGPNMLTNASFEDIDGSKRPKNWIPYFGKGGSASLTTDTEVKHSGTRSMRINPVQQDVSSAPCFRQEFPCAPGEKYIISAYIKTQDVNNSKRIMCITYADKNGKQIGSVPFIGLPKGTADWKLCKATVTVPPNAVLMKPHFFGDHLQRSDDTVKISGIVWIDDVILVKKQ